VRLRAIERGEQAPTREELVRLATLYTFPVRFFTQPIHEDGEDDREDDAVFVCGSWLKEAKPCALCGAIAWYLCDYPMGRGKTCDLALCREHRQRVQGEFDEDDDPDAIDYCPQHARMAAR